MKLEYSEYTDTIRQQPENYLIAYRKGARWICDPDIACNKKLARKVFNSLLDFETRYGTPQRVIERSI